MGSPDAPAADAATVWEYVTPGEYRVPSAPVDQTVKTGLAAFWRKLRPASAPSDQLLTSDTDVENLSDERLAGFVPPPAWDDAAAALDRALNGWTDRPPAASWAVLQLGNPHSGHDKVLRLWAGTRGWRLVREPDVPETLGEHGGWFDGLKGDGSPWVLPRSWGGLKRSMPSTEAPRRASADSTALPTPPAPTEPAPAPTPPTP